VATLATAPAGAVVGDCAPGSDWGTLRTDLSSPVVTLVNSHRAGIGAVALRVSPTLTKAAVWKARHMARYSYMAHDDPAPPVARTPRDRLEACGYPVATAGWAENIAWGYSTAQAVMNTWLNSPTHRANIEKASFRAIGVAAAASASGVLYWAQEFGTYDDSGAIPTSSAPTVALTSSPAASTSATSASFAWSTTGTVTSTTCSLDGAAAVSCASPASYGGLAPGAHNFRVTVANAGGSTSAGYSWTVTTTAPAPAPAPAAPTVTLTSAPASTTYSTSASFAWRTGGTVTTTACSLDWGAWIPCASPKSYAGLSRGYHTFRVRVANAYGSTRATHTWRII
jgi:uncharacterized protein YkwD